MVKNGEGYFIVESTSDRDETVFAYATVPGSGWIVGIEVDSDSRYAKAINGAEASEFTYKGKKGLKFRGGNTIYWTGISDMSVWGYD